MFKRRLTHLYRQACEHIGSYVKSGMAKAAPGAGGGRGALECGGLCLQVIIVDLSADCRYTVVIEPASGSSASNE